MPLMRGPSGKILRRPDGKLACSEDDCCDQPCPDCCIRITSGALIDGEIKIFAFEGDNTLEITIVTPTGTRLVCDDDQIQITILLLVNDAEPPTSPETLLIFDPIWELMGNTPAAPSSHAAPGGYVFWNNVIDGTFTATLKLNSCYFNHYGDLGAIEISGLDIEQVIAIERCNPSTDCCTIVAECKPCCLLLDPAGDIVNPERWVWNTEELRFEWLKRVEFNELKYWLLFWIRPEAGDEPEEYAQWCFDETWIFGLEIGIGNQESTLAISGTSFKVSVNACDFLYIPEPDPNTATVTNTPPGDLTIVWDYPEEGFSPLEYEWTLGRDCSRPGCGEISVGVDFEHPTYSIPGEGIIIELFECETETINGCECGCPCCGGNLPDTLTVEWTYNEVDYSFDLSVSSQDSCGENNRWWLIEPSFENMFPNCGPCGAFLAEFGPSSTCIEFELHNVRVDHDCSAGWVLFLITSSGTSASFVVVPPSPCELPATVTHCGIEYTIKAGA